MYASFNRVAIVLSPDRRQGIILANVVVFVNFWKHRLYNIGHFILSQGFSGLNYDYCGQKSQEMLIAHNVASTNIYSMYGHNIFS